MTPPLAHASRSFDVSRWKEVALGAASSEDTRSATEASSRSWDVSQIWKGCVFEAVVRPGSSASPRFTASCRRDRSLAVIQSLWVKQPAEVPSLTESVAKVHTCAHPTCNAHTSTGRHYPAQSSSCRSVHPHFVRASGIEKEKYCPTACATSPMLVDRDRSFRSWSIYQNRNPRWVSP